MDHQDSTDQGYQTMQQKGSFTTWSNKTHSLGLAAHTSMDAMDVISFHFQQNLLTPNLRHNDVF